MFEVHPGTPVDFEALSMKRSLPSHASTLSLVASSSSDALSAKVTVTAFLKSDAATAPPIEFPIYDIAAAGHETLPPIPYSLRTRKLAIAIIWAIILLDSVVLPIGLFFVLKYGAGWSDVRNLAISNGVFGFVAFIQYALRTYRLIQASPTYRPLDSPRWSLDFYQYQFTLGFILITLLISLTTGPENLRLIALTPAVLPAMCGPQFLFSCWCHKAGWKIPFRFSSTPRGSVAPPAVFTIVEDVVGVDGGGGRVFRAAWKRRYDASAMFREMMWRLTLFWGVGCFLCVAVCCAVVVTVESKYVAFGFGWAAPFGWGGIWAWITIWWVRRMLRAEREAWEGRRSMATI